MARFRWTAAAGACALAVTACGGGGGGSQSKADVVAKANAICKSFEADEARLEKVDAKTPDDVVRLLNEVQAMATRFIDELDALDPSGADAELFQRFIDVSREQIQLMGEMQDAITTSDRARLQAVTEKFDTLNVRADIAAQQYGMDECVGDEWVKAP